MRFFAAGEGAVPYRGWMPGFMSREGSVKIKAGRPIDWQIDSSKVAIDWANSQFLTSECTG